MTVAQNAAMILRYAEIFKTWEEECGDTLKFEVLSGEQAVTDENARLLIDDQTSLTIKFASDAKKRTHQVMKSLGLPVRPISPRKPKKEKQSRNSE